ncbi:hypothetical protein ACP275_04G164100 [Erythranthe tilingii]
MMYINFLNSIIFCIAIPLFFFILSIFKTLIIPPTNLPKSYPVFGSFFTILKNRHRYVQWTAEIVTSTPNLTFSLHRSIGSPLLVITANAANVRHILKSNFNNYVKGDYFTTNMRDFLGDGIFNADGDTWKFQRQVSSHEFNTKSLRKFVETAVDSEISGRLIPVMKLAAGDKTHQLDFQDILQRFAFDNICRIAFGYDPAYLSPSSSPPPEEEKFAAAFQEAIELSRQRFASITPYYWKIKKALNFGSEKQLKIAVDQVREFAKEIINQKKKQLLIHTEKSPSSSSDDEDILSRFLVSGHSDEDFVADIVISFILAGRDTTSAALTWFFWLLSKNPKVEAEILIEVNKERSPSELSSAYDEVKDMVYTHACLCEAMRLYPPVPVDTKAALNDDVLPDGTVVKKGMRVCYHPYAMGRVEEVWGGDWAEFRPERWLEREEGGGAGKWKFVGRDSCTYTVFQAGPRICLGREMAFIQMKRVVAGVLRRFRVVPVVWDGVEPVYVMDFTAKMKGGFPVKIIEREGV